MTMQPGQIQSNWSYSPQSAQEAWRAWVRRTTLQGSSEAFMAGALWALSQSGQQELLDEIAALQRQLQKVIRR